MVVVFKTKNYNEKISKDPSQKEFVEKKLNDLDSRLRLDHYNKNPKCYDKKGVWVYKFQGVGQNMRLVLEEVKDDETGDHQLLIVRDYIPQKEYEPKWRMVFEPMISSGNYLEKFPLDGEERKVALDYFYSKLSPQKEKKQLLPDSLNKWLYDFGMNNQFDIYESNNWPKYQKNLDESSISYIYEIIKKILSIGPDNSNCKSIDAGFRKLYLHEEFEISLVFDYVKFNIEGAPIILLHGWNYLHKKNEIQDLINEAINYEPLQVKENAYSLKSITYSAYRGYPSTIFKVVDGLKRWKEVQIASNRSNLALSPEQVSFLNKIEFPKFINGQAGSGKSEMLMYMFSELHFRKELEEFSGDPIFLTENNELLERAKNDAEIKLLFNARYQDYGLRVSDIRSYFFTFKDFLREKFIDEDDEVFDIVCMDEKYINFYRFKKLYEESYLKEKIKKIYPAELAWFVINTFIRGYSIGKEEYDLDDFNKLARRDKSFITDEIFKGIYSEVYIPFYQKLINKEGYWDRLYLIRYIFNKYNNIPKDKKVTVILCDEAQDFTRLELQFLLRLSIYSEYDVEVLGQAPISFAGDPFQTVNPTGFNLAQINRLFSGELLETYDIDAQESFVYSLFNNYRSTPEIVNLANTIQFIRYKFLDHSELDRAQISRRLSSKKIPVLIKLEKVDHKNLLEKTSLQVFISACDNGEETDYVRNDDVLSDQVVLKSASLSKGNEYDNVVIYKFGQSFCHEFGNNFLRQILSGGIEFSELNPGLQFRLSFFFNKLYVAVTRAKEEIIILDTDLGCQSFWNELKNENYFILDEKSNWGDLKLPELFIEADLAILSVSSLEEAYNNAQSEIEQGEIHRDSEKMILASKWLQKINSDSKYDNLITYCHARAYEYKDDLIRAGDAFSSCGAYEYPGRKKPKELASDCYWRGGYWKKLIDLNGLEIETNPKQEIRVFVSEIMLKSRFDIQKIIKHGYKIQDTIHGDNKFGRKHWEEEFYKIFIDQINKNKESYTGKNKDLAEALNGFDFKNDELKNLIASLYFSAHEYLKAFDLWLSTGYIDHNDFYVTALEVKEDFSDQIFYLDKLERFEEIEKLFIPKKRQLDPSSLDLLINVFYVKRPNSAKLAQLLLEDNNSINIFGKFLNAEQNSKRGQNLFEQVVIYLASIDERIKGDFWNELLQVGLDFFSKILDGGMYNHLTNVLLVGDWNLTPHGKLFLKYLDKSLGGFDFLYSLFKCLAYSDIHPNNYNEGLENLLMNFINFLKFINEKSKRKNVDFVLLTVCLDKVVRKYSTKQQILAGSEGLFLRSLDLEDFDRSIIEERFWMVRYKINTLKNEPIDQIMMNLISTYKMKNFQGVEFMFRRRMMEDLVIGVFDTLPEAPSMSQLINDSSSRKMLDLVERGENKYTLAKEKEAEKNVEDILLNIKNLPKEMQEKILKRLTEK